jgi:uncharacterized membrane protein
MAGNQKFPSDLLFVAGLVILTDIFVFIPVLSESFIRTVLGLPLMLFLPGYALVALLFPAKSGLEGIERAALSVGISVAIVPIIGLVLNNTSFGIREIPLLAASLCSSSCMCSSICPKEATSIDKALEVSSRFCRSLLIEVLENRISTKKHSGFFWHLHSGSVGTVAYWT